MRLNRWGFSILLVGSALTLAGCDLFCDDRCKAARWREEAAAQKADFVASQPTPLQGITLAEFNALKPGTTYDEAVDIVGLDGRVLSENQLGGVRTVMVMWDGENGKGANANAIFQNGKLVQKAQFGLEYD